MGGPEGHDRPGSAMIKRSVTIAGHQTSLSLETEFWDELKNIARARNISLKSLLSEIDSERPSGQNLSSAARVYILREFRAVLERTGR